MRVDESNYNNEKRYVVLVNAHDFLASWARDPNNFEAQLSRGNKQDWVNDYKYPKAESGFSQGRGNPVPLAKVVCRQDETFEPVYASFLILLKKRKLDGKGNIKIPQYRTIPIPESVMNLVVLAFDVLAKQKKNNKGYLWPSGENSKKPVDAATVYRWTKRNMIAADVTGKKATTDHRNLFAGYGW